MTRPRPVGRRAPVLNAATVAVALADALSTTALGEGGKLTIGKTTSFTLFDLPAAEYDMPYAPPAWFRKAAGRGKVEFRDDTEKLVVFLCLMHPRGFVPTRGELGELAEAVLSCVEWSIPRAAVAVAGLHRTHFVIPAEHIRERREERAIMRAIAPEEKTDE